jgi:hypothetical protein
MIFSLLGALSIGVMATPKGFSDPSTVFAKEPEKIFPVLEDLHWNMGGTGSVVIADFILVNRSKTTWKDVMVSCGGTAKNGTRIGHNTAIIFEKFSPGKAKKVADFNMGIIDSQVTQVSCEVVNAVEIK